MCGRSLRAHGRAAAVRMRLLCRPQLHARGRCHAEHAPVHSKWNGGAPNAAGGSVLRPRHMHSCGCTGTRVGYRRSLFATRRCGSRLRTPRAHKRLPCVHEGPNRATARLLTAACAAARVRHSRAQLGSKARRSASAARTGQAPLAIRYNDKSVLESMHSAELFTIMQDADCNVLATLPEDQQRLVRAKARPAAVRCGVLGGLHCSGAAPSHSAAERTGSALADHLDDPRHRHGVPFQAPGRVQGQDA